MTVNLGKKPPLRQRPLWRFRHEKPIFAPSEDSFSSHPRLMHLLQGANWNYLPRVHGLNQNTGGHWVPPGFKPATEHHLAVYKPREFVMPKKRSKRVSSAVAKAQRPPGRPREPIASITNDALWKRAQRADNRAPNRGMVRHHLDGNYGRRSSQTRYISRAAHNRVHG